MKTIKSILIAATLMGASVVSPVAALDKTEVALGDTVMIKPETTKYLTGETPSTWVYSKPHTIGQIGTKRFPDGILLMNICSWVGIDDIMVVNPADRKAQEVKKAAKEEKAAAVVEEAQVVEEVTPVDEVQPVPEPQPVVSEVVVVEEIKSDSTVIVEEKKEEEVIAEEEPQEIAPETATAKHDSLRSKQSFDHGYHRFSIGLRGGAAGLLHKTDVGKWVCGGDAVLDLQYAYYWTKDGRPMDFGIITGIGLGYANSGLKASVDSTYSVTTDAGTAKATDINYTLKADKIKENDGQLQLEIPVMFSLIHENGLFFNVGPKFMLPVFTHFGQKISDPHVTAYFPQYKVAMTDEVLTGLVKDDQLVIKGKDFGNQFSINIMLTAELGYEWVLSNGGSIGLGAFADYCVYNSFKNNASNASLIGVTPPTSAGSGAVAQVSVLSATQTYAQKLGFFDVGVKVAYHFNFPQKMCKKFKTTELDK